MKIESYNVQMQSSSSFVQKEIKTTNSSLTMSSPLQNEANENLKKLSDMKAVFSEEEYLNPLDKIKKRIIELLLERYFEKNVSVHPSKKNAPQVQNSSDNPYSNLLKGSSWGFSYESTQEYYQKSSVDFSTQASVKTNNGEFNIDINLSLTQEFYEMHKTSFSLGATFEDPLIINHDSDIGTFDNINTNMSFEFDLNGDGENEQIPELKNGSGFLALDKNGNNKIDDGSELFGPTTGDGFEELRAYDEDGNNWIDENDSIYSKLLIWERDNEGNNSLIGLGQAGVGAIYLAGVTTDYNYATGYDDIKANMKEASFFLKENGEAGIVSSVDFAV